MENMNFYFPLHASTAFLSGTFARINRVICVPLNFASPTNRISEVTAAQSINLSDRSDEQIPEKQKSDVFAYKHLFRSLLGQSIYESLGETGLSRIWN